MPTFNSIILLIRTLIVRWLSFVDCMYVDCTFVDCTYVHWFTWLQTLQSNVNVQFHYFVDCTYVNCTFVDCTLIVRWLYVHWLYVRWLHIHWLYVIRWFTSISLCTLYSYVLSSNQNHSYTCFSVESGAMSVHFHLFSLLPSKFSTCHARKVFALFISPRI